MIDKPEWKPQKGFVYIKDVEPGQLVETESKNLAIVLDHTEAATIVCAKDSSDAGFKTVEPESNLSNVIIDGVKKLRRVVGAK